MGNKHTTHKLIKFAKDTHGKNELKLFPNNIYFFYLLSIFKTKQKAESRIRLQTASTGPDAVDSTVNILKIGSP